jgi:hypothetical protein
MVLDAELSFLGVAPARAPFALAAVMVVSGICFYVFFCVFYVFFCALLMC